MLAQEKLQAQLRTSQTWNKPTALAQVGDEIQIPFTPVMQVVDREVLADGRVRLLVKPISASYSEEWVVQPEPIVEQQSTSAPSKNIEASQPVGFAGDVTSCQLQLNWQMLTEYEAGCTHGKLDAANRMQPICSEANCPYSQGYLDAYNSFIAASQQLLQNPQPVGWSVVHDPKWDVYQVWISDRCLQQKAISYEEGDRIAQRYVAAEELIRQQNQVVLAGYVE